MESQEVQISHESSDGLLKVKVSGPVELQAVTMYTTRFQDVWTRHDRVLWDLSDVDPSAITSDDILNLNHAFDEILRLRAGGKTAVIVAKDLELIANVAIGLCDANSAPVTFSAFLEEDEAIVWLNA